MISWDDSIFLGISLSESQKELVGKMEFDVQKYYRNLARVCQACSDHQRSHLQSLAHTCSPSGAGVREDVFLIWGRWRKLGVNTGPGAHGVLVAWWLQTSVATDHGGCCWQARVWTSQLVSWSCNHNDRGLGLFPCSYQGELPSPAGRAPEGLSRALLCVCLCMHAHVCVFWLSKQNQRWTVKWLKTRFYSGTIARREKRPQYGSGIGY